MSLWGKKTEPSQNTSRTAVQPVYDAVEIPVVQASGPSSQVPLDEKVEKTSFQGATKRTTVQKESMGTQSQEQVEEIILSRFGKARSALGPGTIVQGKLAFDAPVRIDGELSGELTSTKLIVVGNTGRIIDVEVKAADLVVFGHVKGTITVTGKLEILGNGVVEGVVEAAQLIVDGEGCLIGSCRMSKWRASALLEKQTDLKSQEAHSDSSQNQLLRDETVDPLNVEQQVPDTAEHVEVEKSTLSPEEVVLTEAVEASLQ